MKNKFLKMLGMAAMAAIVCAGFALAGCSGTESGGGDDTDGGDDTFTASDAATMIAGFSGSHTTVSATFSQDVSMSIASDDSSYEKYSSYESDVDDTVTLELDLTAGGVYYYASKKDADGEVTEQIVSLSGDTYYYAETDTPQTALASEDDAVEMISELLASISYSHAGYIDSDAFVYTGSDWIQAYVLLGTENLSATDSYFTYSYSKTDDSGLTVGLEAKYVGYYGDAGTFDFGTSDDYTGTTLTLTTDADGNILSFSETLNNYLELNIVSPAVPLSLTGTKTLEASYDGTVSQKSLDDVNAEVASDSDEETATTGTIVVYANDNATVTAYDFDYSTYAFTEGTEVEAGHYVAVTVTPADGYSVAVVLVNGVSANYINGYYCHMTPVTAGTVYTVSVTVIASSEEVSESATVTVNNDDTLGTVMTYDFDYSTFAFTEGTEVEAGHYVAVTVTPADGYEVSSVTVNGQDTTNFSGYYCYMVTAVAGAEYVVDVAYAEEGASSDSAYGTIVVESAENCTYTVYDFDYSTFAFTEGTSVEEGHFVAVSVTPDDGYEVTSVTVNGNAATYINGYYCYMSAAVAGTTYTVVITVSAS